MGWGIRGQYGHETGAMIAGVLVGFAAVLLFIPDASSLHAARVVAITAIGISFGGSETYAQSVGLTQDAAFIGNWPALRWGLLGLALKGGLWIGLGGAFLGMGLGGKRYRTWEMTLVMAGLLALLYLGLEILNEPFNPEHKILPRLYFSHDWRWNPDADFKPRREIWGGLLLAFLGLTAYFGLIRRDRLATNMSLVGFLAGSIGFPLGQCIQAFHAWNPSLYTQGVLGMLEPYMNWWNMMEISFGLSFGAMLGAGLWINRRLIYVGPTDDEVVFSPIVEIPPIAVYISLLIAAEFFSVPIGLKSGAKTLTIGVLPLVGILGGRFSPYLIALPIVALPIALKTLREMCYRHSEISPRTGWLVLVVIPLGVLLWRAIVLAKKGQGSSRFVKEGLLLCTLIYFCLNFVFFRYPWPWDHWTGRTPSAIIFTVCAILLTAAALVLGRPSDESIETRGASPAAK
jgi:hypothetical protein